MLLYLKAKNKEIGSQKYPPNGTPNPDGGLLPSILMSILLEVEVMI